MNQLLFYVVILMLLLAFLYVENRSHMCNLARLSLRIHVNGTRGKSSVTRLIAAGLRNGKYKAFAKTTGTEPKFIFSDGREELISRRGPANIRENIKLVKQAVDNGANAIVFECMAIRPELQLFCERRLIKSHIGVITNIRADHEDVMGSSLVDVAAALSNTIPSGGILVTTPEAKILLEKYCENTQVFVADCLEFPAEVFQGFPYEVVPENVALALKVCELAGIDAVTAVSGMRKASPDAGNSHISEFAACGKRIKVIDVLAANDPESTLWLWNHYLQKQEVVVVLLNCRKDRKFRTVQLCELFAKKPINAIIVAGDTAFATLNLLRQGVPKNKIYLLKKQVNGFNNLLDILARIKGEKLTVFAAGNIKGLSEEFRAKLNGG
jgi:gamma-polyglutamate synthase